VPISATKENESATKDIEGATKTNLSEMGNTGLERRIIPMYTFNDLVNIIAELRSDHGCPWDKEQTYESLKKCVADETQEVFDAVDHQDMENLCEELGDVLMQIMMYSQIAREEGAFSIDDVIDGVCRKLVRRHPHVFGDAKVNSAEEGLALWNAVKAEEKRMKKAQQKAERP